MAGEELVREILSRRDPHGYYVIPALPEAADEVSRLGVEGVKLDYAGDVVYVKVRSRSAAARIARHLLKRGLLYVEGEELGEAGEGGEAG